MDFETGRAAGEPSRMTNEAGGASVASSATTGGKRLLLYKMHSRQDVFVGSLTPDGSRLNDVRRVTFKRASPAQWVVDDDGPADFATIQAAIEAFYVHTGDTILVKPGLHLGNAVLTSKDLVIRSEAATCTRAMATLTGRTEATAWPARWPRPPSRTRAASRRSK